MGNTPNVKNIDKLIKLLKSLPEKNKKLKEGNKKKFGMSNWNTKNECGTFACLGGWAETIMIKEMIEAGADKTDIPQGLEVSEVGKWLGLGWRSENNMFYMMNCTEGRSGVSIYLFDAIYSHETRTKIAVKMLQRYKETGEVNWGHAMKGFKEDGRKKSK